jgi:DNA-binding NtrC family response regulator
MAYNILIVDDETNTLKVLAAALRGNRYHVETAGSGEEALVMLKDRPYHLVLSDYKMEGMSGEQLLEKVKTCFPQMPFVLLTAFGTIELAVHAMRKGAYTYLTKPVDVNLLESVVSDALQAEKRAPTREQGWGLFPKIIGRSPAMQEVFSLMRRVSKTNANILILGESGTGKELVARAVHYASLRADQPFLPVDCTTIPAELMESELFGHEKGAFTGAVNAKVGLIEMAQGGTIFFDEIGDLGLALEKKLLRFLQEREIRRVGGKEKLAVDVRVLAATNRDIEAAVERNEFRADLYYRLNVITIRLPPLRGRQEDILLLAAHYLDHFCEKNRKKVNGLDREVRNIFLQYDWPGNVRELENVIERAVILCPPQQTINAECLPRRLNQFAIGKEKTRELSLPDMEKRIIRKALDRTAWNQSQAAILLGISRKQLRTRMKNLGLLPVKEV